MNTNTMELNLNEMAMVNGGGDTADHVAGALMGAAAGKRKSGPSRRI